jgi:hypothetical protein
MSTLKRYRTMNKVDLFYTPTSMKDLEDRLESFSGSEKPIAWLAAMMAWNLACDISNNEQEDK